jgi:hypothetical protein
MPILVRLTIGVIICLGIAALFYYLMTSMIPGQAAGATAPAGAIAYDPNDQTPRPPVLPAGPHQDVFDVNCIACHSTRLIMTQPSFPEKTWGETVHKMVDKYGAKLTPEMEKQIVQYLVAVKGQGN